jgi:hypothetical protein
VQPGGPASIVGGAEQSNTPLPCEPPSVSQPPAWLLLAPPLLEPLLLDPCVVEVPTVEVLELPPLVPPPLVRRALLELVRELPPLPATPVVESPEQPAAARSSKDKGRAGDAIFKIRL